MKFNSKFNINSPRSQQIDYSNGIFFVTICSANKINFFGNILENKINLTEEGKILDEIWRSIPLNFDFAEIGEFVVMPNHFHGIISVFKNPVAEQKNKFEVRKSGFGGFAGEKNPMVNESLSTIIRWFKGKCTFEIRKFNKEFSWQSRFYEHLIRDQKSYQNIENYIVENVENWDKDSWK